MLRCCLLLSLALTTAARADLGPGLANGAWSADQVFEPIALIDSPGGHGNVAMVQGYLMVIYSSDGGGDDDDGGIEFWDVSVAETPTLVVRHDDDDTHGLREAHGFSLAWQADRLVLAAQGVEGIQLWDVTDPLDIALLAYLDLPGITRGDYSGDWWTFWQAPWLYVAGTDSGLYVVDARDLAAPVLVKQVPTGDLGGVSPAQVFAVGNLLVIMEAQGRGYATLDISIPDAPRLLRAFDGNAGYSNIFAGPGLILTSGNIPPRVSVHRVSSSGGIEHVSTFAFIPNSGGYGSYQDGVFHTGFSDRYLKADVVDNVVVGDGSSGLDDRDEDFATVLGNLVFAGNDHGNGSALIAHQAGPDLTAPVVEWMHPPDGATNAAITSRIGLSFSDHIDVGSLTDETVRLEDAGGLRVPITLSTQLSLVNLAPNAPLTLNSSYRVVVEGVRDVAGNASPRFEGTITTGSGGAPVDPATVVTGLTTRSLFGDSGLATFGVGVATYLDRDFAFQPGFPSRLDGQPLIQTRNNDKASISADFMSFTLTTPAELVVLYDARASSPPDWLADFTATGEAVENDDAAFDVYARSVPAGLVTLGGNRAAGADGAESMYAVVVVRTPLSCSLALSPALAGTLAITATGPADARYDWAVGTQLVDDAGTTLPVALEVGRHSVVVTVSRNGEVATCSGVQVVHRPFVNEPGRSSSPLLWDRGRVITVNPDNGTVAAVDVVTQGRIWETPTGAHPVSVARQIDGRLWILDRDESAIVVVDADSGAVAARITLPRATRPEGLVITADGDAFVTLAATGEVLRLDVDGAITARAVVVPTASGLTHFAGKLYVSRFLSPDDQGEVVVVDAATLTVTGTIALPFDAGPDTEASGRGVPSQLSPLRIAPDGVRAYVSGTKANIARGLFRDGLPLTFEQRTRSFVATIDLVTRTEITAARLDINDRDGVQASALSPAGDLLFVAARGGNVVDVFDVLTGRRVSQFPVGKAPMGIAFDDDARIAVHNLMSRSVSVFDATELLSGRGSHVAAVGDVVTVATERLTPEVLRGKALFYDAADRRLGKDGYIACASCHLDGGHDGRTWDFTQAGEGLRNTISLHGRAGTGHGRVHWSGNFDEIQDFEHDIRNAFGGTGLLSDDDFAATSDPLGVTKAGRSADLDALAAYVTSLRAVPPSPHRDVDGALTASARRGRVVFTASDCQQCHGGDAFSDFARHDVDTAGPGSGLGIGQPLAGAGFDTPTLKGIFDTAPYLHDGSAPTLADVLRRHGAIPAFDDDEARDLIAYLQALDKTSSAPESDCATSDECVIVDPPDPIDPVDPIDPIDPDDDDDVPDSCGCGAAGLDAGALALLGLLLRRRRRR